MRVGLTGGIGSGKTEVARRLAALGAVVIDYDVLAREVVAPGTPGLAAVVAEFGDAVLDGSGALDRARLAAVVFADEAARRRLNAIVHPLVGARAAQIEAQAAPEAVVVHDIPLLVEGELAAAFDAVVVVVADPQTQVARLVGRGLDEADARARIGVQASAAERAAVATHLVANESGLSELDDRVRRLWAELTDHVADR